MGTGTPISTGDIITAAKMNLKQETGASLAVLGILDQSGAGSFDLRLVVSETLGANRNLTLKVNDVARTIDLGGDITLAGALTTAGAFALTLTATNTTNATIPAGTVTLADLSTAQTIAGAKTFGTAALKINNPAGTFAYTVTSGAIAAARILNLPVLIGTDTLAVLDMIQTFTNKTLTSPAINTPTIIGGTATALTGLGIRSTGAAFDLTLASTEVFTAGRTLTVTLNNAARAVDLTGNLTLVGNLTTVGAFATTGGAFSCTLTLAGNTNVTLPASGTLAVLGANTFTAAQTIDGNVDTVLNITASPIIDIGADVFAAGTFVDISYDTAQALTGALSGVNIDLGTNVTTAGAGAFPVKGLHIDLGPLTFNAAFNNTVYGIHLECDPTLTDESITGILVTMPATFGTGTEYGVSITGDGQTINIGNDADLYISLAKASSVDISIQGVTPVIDIGADVLPAGYFLSIDYDTIETTTGDLYIMDVFRAAFALTLGADLYGINLDFNSNVTAVADRDVIGYRLTTPALTSAGANITNYTGFNLPTAGALVMNNGGGALNWYGMNLQMPNITQTAGTMTAIGIQLTEGTTTSGTINAININGVGVDTIINFSASPIIDIGADVLSAGTIIDFTYDTAEVATGAIIGISLNLNTNLTPLGGQNITSITTQTAAFTNAAAAATVITGFQLPTAGALVSNNAGAALTWYGADLQMPNITQTSGAMVATGLRITEGTTTSGTATGININVTRALAFAKASDIIILADTAAVLDLNDGTTNILRVNDQITTDNVITLTITGQPTAFDAAAGSTYSAVSVAAHTVTLGGAVGVTAMSGLQLNLAAPTITSAAAPAVALASTLYVAAPVAAGTATITAGYSGHFASQIRLDGNLSMANAAYDIVMIANTAVALEISDGTTKNVAFDTRTTASGVNVVLHTFSAPTFVSAAGSTYNHIELAAGTITLTGGTGVTAMDGLQLNLLAPTLAADGATTVTTASTLYVAAPGVGANMTITNRYIINTSVAGCYLTAAGVWTDVPSTITRKKNVETWDFAELPELLEQIRPVKFQYDQSKFQKGIVISDEERYGIVAEELPKWLRSPGDNEIHGISGSVLATFALAALKWLKKENEELKRRLGLLEAKLQMA